jgi:serine/threonine-protein kinase
MFWTRADGAAKPQPLTRSTNQQYPSSVTADGKRLAFYELNPKTGFDIWTVPLEVTGGLLQAGKPEIFVQTPFDERHPSFSPDGRWLAYASAESGIQQVYVRESPGRAPGASGRWLISNGGGGYPVWSRHGQELFFRSADDKIIVAAYTVTGNSFVAHKPRVWSEKKLAHVGFLGAYDVASDGKRIVALEPVENPDGQKAQNHVIFLLNFFDELRRRVPAGSK